MKQRGILRPALMLLMSLAVMLSIAGAALAGGSGPFHFGFKSVNGQPPPSTRRVLRSSLQKYDAIFMGDAEQKELYLTFDNGYENRIFRIPDTLEKKVPATFS